MSGRRVFDTDELKQLADDVQARATKFGDIAKRAVAVVRSVEAQGVDAYPVIISASKTRHLSNRLLARPGQLRQLAAWIEAIERDPLRIPPLPPIPGLSASLAVGGVAGGALAQELGRKSLTLAPSADGPKSRTKYTSPAVVGWLGEYGPRGANKYNCTAWANFRWKELLYKGDPIGGHGFQMAGKAGNLSDIPSLGALASYPDGGYGHVMVVEEVEFGPTDSFQSERGEPERPGKLQGLGSRNPLVEAERERLGARGRAVPEEDDHVRSVSREVGS